MPPAPPRPRSTLLTMLLLWVAFYASFTLFMPSLLDDADSVHVEVAREMLLRHDYITLYANGIRYLEKAPLLYWSMAACIKFAMLFGALTPQALAAAARLPVAFDVLGLVWLIEMLARRMFRNTRAGHYAALTVLSSTGIFLFSRITLPDAGVCLWTALAMLALWKSEQESSPQNWVSPSESPQTRVPHLRDSSTVAKVGGSSVSRSTCFTFAIACALNVLTKGLIGVVFPVTIALIYFLLTRGVRGTWQRLRQLHPLTSLLVFFVIAAPWHILAGLANPTQGHPAQFLYVNGHWQTPLPTDGNVRGWFWFYFMNEHVLRYLNLRVPRDYDTAPLWLFWGLCFIWLMPWSAFVFHAVAEPVKQWFAAIRVRLTTPNRITGIYTPQPDRAQTLLLIWAALPLLFFSLSTRQEYYVLPALPAFAILIAGWLAREPAPNNLSSVATKQQRSALRITAILLALGTLFAFACAYFLLHTRAPAANTDLATLLAQNPGDYALSMGHFLDMNAQALGLFRLPLTLAALSLFFCPLAAFILRRRAQPHSANLALAAGTFGFLLAAHLGLQTFAPVISSAQLAQQIAPQVQPQDLIMIHGEYEAGSTLGFYLQRSDIHILEGRSSNLWYGSFFPDAPHIFETPQTLALKWLGPQRIFLWQATTDSDAPQAMPAVSGPVYVVASGGGKEILSNQPNR